MGTLGTVREWFDECFVKVGGDDGAPAVEVELRGNGQLVAMLLLMPDEARSLQVGLVETLGALERLWTDVGPGRDSAGSHGPDTPF